MAKENGTSKKASDLQPILVLEAKIFEAQKVLDGLREKQSDATREWLRTYGKPSERVLEDGNKLTIYKHGAVKIAGEEYEFATRVSSGGKVSCFVRHNRVQAEEL